MRARILLILAAMALFLSSCGCHNRYGTFHRPSGWAYQLEAPSVLTDGVDSQA